MILHEDLLEIRETILGSYRHQCAGLTQMDISPETVLTISKLYSMWKARNYGSMNSRIAHEVRKMCCIEVTVCEQEQYDVKTPIDKAFRLNAGEWELHIPYDHCRGLYDLSHLCNNIPELSNSFMGFASWLDEAMCIFLEGNSTNE